MSSEGESMVRKIVENAQPAGPRLLVTTLSGVEPEEVNWLWPGRIPRGKTTLLAGDAGLGKSYLSLDIAARVSTGGTWPDGGDVAEGDVLIVTAEDGLADTVRPRLDNLGADVSRVHHIDVTVSR
jgi:RecA-family ATPase